LGAFGDYKSIFFGVVKERDFGKVIKPASILGGMSVLGGKDDFGKRKVIPTIGYTFDGRGDKMEEWLR